MKLFSNPEISYLKLPNNFQWLRVLIIICLIVFSMAVSIIPSIEILWSILGLIGGIGGAVVVLRSPFLGLAVLIIGSFIIPFSIRTGTQTGLNFTVIVISGLIALWILRVITQRCNLKIFFSGSEVALIAFAIVAVLAFIVGQISWFPSPGAPIRTQLGGLAVFILSIGGFFLVSHQSREERQLEWLVWIFVVLGAFYVCGLILPGIGRITQVLVDPGATGTMFWVWLLALTTSQFLFNRKLAFQWRILLALLIIGILYVTMIQRTSWISGWLPPLIAFAAIFLLGTPRLALFGTFFLVVILFISEEWVSGYIMAGDNPYSLLTRQEAWEIILKLLKKNPFLGFGPANYYFLTGMYPIRGWFVNFSSHNNYVDILAQTGIVGLSCFLWFAFEIGKLLLRLRNRFSEGFNRAYVYGAFGGLVGTLFAGMLGDWFLPFVYNVGLAGMRSSILPWLFLGGVLALSRFSPVISERGEMLVKQS